MDYALRTFFFIFNECRIKEKQKKLFYFKTGGCTYLVGIQYIQQDIQLYFS